MITIKEALDILDERDRAKGFRMKIRSSRDKSKEEYGFNRAAYEEDYFQRKRQREIEALSGHAV
jgi:hypothetical protein